FTRVTNCAAVRPMSESGATTWASRHTRGGSAPQTAGAIPRSTSATRRRRRRGGDRRYHHASGAAVLSPGLPLDQGGSVVSPQGRRPRHATCSHILVSLSLHG